MWGSYVKIFKNSKALYESWKSQVQFSAQDISTFTHFNVVIKSSVSRQRIGKSSLWFWFPYLLCVWSHAFALKKKTVYAEWSISMDIYDQILYLVILSRHSQHGLDS